MGEFVESLGADVGNGGEETGAVVGDDFVFADGLRCSLRERQDFFFSFPRGKWALTREKARQLKEQFTFIHLSNNPEIHRSGALHQLSRASVLSASTC